MVTSGGRLSLSAFSMPVGDIAESDGVCAAFLSNKFRTTGQHGSGKAANSLSRAGAGAVPL
jgi:hypothetical protein